MNEIQNRRRALMGVGAGNSNELTGPWGRIYVEKVTAGANSVANMQAAIAYVSGLREDTTGTTLSIWRINADSPSAVEYEFGGITMARSGIRKRNGVWNYNVGVASNYDAVLTSGSVYFVISGEFNKL